MKINPPAKPRLLRVILLIACFLLVIICNKPMAAGLPTVHKSGNRVTVNFKHDLERNELTIRVKSDTETIMQLYIFTPDGILVKEVDISTIKMTIIKGLKKGYYLYDCFDNDERMKRGSLKIK